jgi:HAD superfamily hydrolase (TIGR01509 family)
MKFQAVLFDCDGVLVDSEPITNGVLRSMLIEQGWDISAQECFATFVGHAVVDRQALIEQHTGKSVTAQWLQQFRDRRDAALREQLVAVPHIHYAVKALHSATQGRIACASGADRGKLMLQLTKVELLPYFEGRLFSGVEHARNKPHPEVYLAAAKALATDPQHCAVVEDTPNGTRAGVAAGCTVWGYAPLGGGDALLQAGAHHVFESMADLPEALGMGTVY